MFLGFCFLCSIVVLNSPSGASPLPPINKLTELPSYIEPDFLTIEAFYTNNDDELEIFKKKGKKRPVSRIIAIGDIHGTFNVMRKLLKKVNYNSKIDQLVLLGDFISKGEQNFEVLDYAIANNAACVLGNHEIRILQKYTTYFSYENPKFCTKIMGNDTCIYEQLPSLVTNKKVKYDQELSIAKRLKQKHVDYLTNCSILIELGPIGHGLSDKSKRQHDTNLEILSPQKPLNDDNLRNKKNYNYSIPIEGIAVHAGLQWHLGLTEQSVDVVTNIRGLYKPNYIEPCYESKGIIDETITKPWSEIFNLKQQERSWNERKIVLYGHESSRGLVIRDYTKGLDSDCYKGGQLSSIIIDAEYSKKHKKIIYHESIVSVDC